MLFTSAAKLCFITFSLKLFNMAKIKEPDQIPSQNGLFVFTAVTRDRNVEGSYLLSAEGAVWRTSNFLDFTLIIGTPQSNEYKTGSGATYGSITGLLTPTISPTTIFLIDKAYHCIRKLVPSQNTYEDSQLGGKCGTAGSVDGTASNARLTSPDDIIEQSPDNLIFSEIRKIRRFYYNAQTGWHVETLKVVDQDIRGIAIPPTIGKIYIAFTANFRVLENSQLTLLTNQFGYGHIDGALAESKVHNLRHIVCLTDKLLLLADQENHVLRLVNLEDSTISTICASPPYIVSETTSISRCRMFSPHLLQIDEKNKIVYVFDAKGVKKLTYDCE